MVSCKFCDTANSIDSAFCKRCGRVIPEEEIRAARARLDMQVAEGFALLSEGKAAEALALADDALADDPSTARAWSLRGHALERRGDLRDALVAYQNALRYDPSSAADRIKVSQLGGIEGSLEARRPDRRVAAAAGIATCVLAISIGAFAATRSQPPKTKPVAALENEVEPKDSQYSYFPVPTPRERRSETENSSGDAAQNVSEPRQTTTSRTTTTLPPPPSGILPEPEGSGQITGPIEIKPLDLSRTAINRPASQSDPEPEVVAEEPPEIEVSVNQPPKEEPNNGKGYISIKVSGEEPVPASSPVMDANGIEALVRTARGQYQVGNYDAAASTYERALAAGADPASINQRLAQTYEKLGRTSDAIQAYQRSVSALERAIASGKGDKERLTVALETSKQALKVLQGG